MLRGIEFSFSKTPVLTGKLSVPGKKTPRYQNPKLSTMIHMMMGGMSLDKAVGRLHKWRLLLGSRELDVPLYVRILLSAGREVCIVCMYDTCMYCRCGLLSSGLMQAGKEASDAGLNDNSYLCADCRAKVWDLGGSQGLHLHTVTTYTQPMDIIIYAGTDSYVCMS